MIDLDTLIDAYGSITKAAKAVGVQRPTFNSWRIRGSVPEWRQRDIDAAYAARIAALTSSPSAAIPPAPTPPAVADVAAGAFTKQ